MRLILLGGNGVVNKEWIKKIERVLKPNFVSTKILNYDHWQTNQPMIDLDKEKEKLTKIAKNSGNFVIFAKSAGILIVLKTIFENKISPKKCIFVGIPLKWARENNFDIDTWFNNYSTSTLVIQHTKDPFASSEELKQFLSDKNVKNTETEVISGESHDYNELELLRDFIIGFVEMMDPLRGIDSTKYLKDSLDLTEKEECLSKELLDWLPNEIVDCHTHCNLRDHVQEVDEKMYHQMISTFVGFSLEDSYRTEGIFFKNKHLKRLRFPFPFRGIDIKTTNEYLLSNVKEPDRIALCGIPSDINYTISMLETGKFNALKMYHQQFNPPSEQIYEYFPPEILGVAEKMEIPIILHLPKMITTCKEELLDVIKDFPNLKISLAHLGLPHSIIPDLAETYEEISKHPNIYMDTAMVPSRGVLTMAIRIFGPKRIMFGSDEPINLVRSVVYQNPKLGQRIVTEYMYHWVNKKEHEKYKEHAKGATHMHWPALQAIKAAVESLYMPKKQQVVKNDIFCNNATRFFKFV
ncbi:amidohydrolase [Patescibacteria group bacterium]|nr:amidohydrolase [Patescibacteria group bacterium]MBU4390010.1 amidohydrolase [Patescibacteria group bacterium]MBU4430790.1 amidohydrolase [Patescibacteria group bacterium]MBU4579222.1 amidohydrolase [Patescibacteria group bacterium]MCG2702476.1 amidohydrolase [Candidatus Parcubacteria bacterium]